MKKIIGWVLTLFGMIVAISSYSFKRVCIAMCEPGLVGCVSPCANSGFDFTPFVVLIIGLVLLVIGVIILIKIKNKKGVKKK